MCTCARVGEPVGGWWDMHVAHAVAVRTQCPIGTSVDIIDIDARRDLSRNSLSSLPTGLFDHTTELSLL